MPRPRHNIISVPTITYRSGEARWIMTSDNQGNLIPKRLKIISIGVKPTVASIYCIRIYSKASCIRDANDDDYSLCYEANWSDFTANSDELSFVNLDQAYVDDDAANENAGTIHGTVEIKALAPNSGFKIDIAYIEN